MQCFGICLFHCLLLTGAVDRYRQAVHGVEKLAALAPLAPCEVVVAVEDATPASQTPGHLDTIVLDIDVDVPPWPSSNRDI